MNCKCCKHFHKSSTLSVGETNLVISFTDSPTAADKDRFCFVICQPIPESGKTLPVQVVVNGVAVPLWNKYGNLVYGYDLKSRCCYKGFFGTGTANHVILNNFPVTTNCNCNG